MSYCQNENQASLLLHHPEKNISHSIWIMNPHCNYSCRLKCDISIQTNQLGDKIFWRPRGDISSVVVILSEGPLKLRMSCWPAPGLKCLHLWTHGLETMNTISSCKAFFPPSSSSSWIPFGAVVHKNQVHVMKIGFHFISTLTRRRTTLEIYLSPFDLFGDLTRVLKPKFNVT